jgi:tRNA threonylcarbamoyladenosine biosynthesis protein TsaE
VLGIRITPGELAGNGGLGYYTLHMTAAKIVRIDSSSAAITEAIAEQLGQKLKGGEVIELTSDLGGGKTTFVRGLARGLGSQAHVSSPTFKISNVYKSPKLELHHFDFYRLNEPGVVANELAEVLGDPSIVVVIEWGEIVNDVLPAKRLTIRLTATDDQTRTLEFDYPKELQYLVKDLS